MAAQIELTAQLNKPYRLIQIVDKGQERLISLQNLPVQTYNGQEPCDPYLVLSILNTPTEIIHRSLEHDLAKHKHGSGNFEDNTNPEMFAFDKVTGTSIQNVLGDDKSLVLKVLQVLEKRDPELYQRGKNMCAKEVTYSSINEFISYLHDVCGFFVNKVRCYGSKISNWSVSYDMLLTVYEGQKEDFNNFTNIDDQKFKGIEFYEMILEVFFNMPLIQSIENGTLGPSTGTSQFAKSTKLIENMMKNINALSAIKKAMSGNNISITTKQKTKIRKSLVLISQQLRQYNGTRAVPMTMSVGLGDIKANSQTKEMIMAVRSVFGMHLQISGGEIYCSHNIDIDRFNRLLAWCACFLVDYSEDIQYGTFASSIRDAANAMPDRLGLKLFRQTAVIQNDEISKTSLHSSYKKYVQQHYTQKEYLRPKTSKISGFTEYPQFRRRLFKFEDTPNQIKDEFLTVQKAAAILNGNSPVTRGSGLWKILMDPDLCIKLGVLGSNALQGKPGTKGMRDPSFYFLASKPNTMPSFDAVCRFITPNKNIVVEKEIINSIEDLSDSDVERNIEDVFNMIDSRAIDSFASMFCGINKSWEKRFERWDIEYSPDTNDLLKIAYASLNCISASEKFLRFRKTITDYQKETKAFSDGSLVLYSNSMKMDYLAEDKEDLIKKFKINAYPFFHHLLKVLDFDAGRDNFVGNVPLETCNLKIDYGLIETSENVFLASPYKSEKDYFTKQIDLEKYDSYKSLYNLIIYSKIDVDFFVFNRQDVQDMIKQRKKLPDVFDGSIQDLLSDTRLIYSPQFTQTKLKETKIILGQMVVKATENSLLFLKTGEIQTFDEIETLTDSIFDDYEGENDDSSIVKKVSGDTKNISDRDVGFSMTLEFELTFFDGKNIINVINEKDMLSKIIFKQLYETNEFETLLVSRIMLKKQKKDIMQKPADKFLLDITYGDISNSDQSKLTITFVAFHYASKTPI